jgi:hypothetical protein
MNKPILALATTCLLGSCATGETTLLSESPAQGPKVIALDAPRTPG